MFTATPEAGIERYAHSATAAEIETHIRNIYSPFDPRDVGTFTTQDAFLALVDTEDTPVVVKFFENWCAHCKALKKPYNIAATKLRHKARFVEVECSKDDHTRAFCARHEARAFPVLRAFSSERGAKFDFDSRSVINLEKFVDAFAAGAVGDISAKNPQGTSSGSTGTSNSHSHSNAGSAAAARSANANANANSASASASAAAAAAVLARSASVGPSLGVEAACGDRVIQLERAVAALTLRLEALERK